jgi:hypothetical protein
MKTMKLIMVAILLTFTTVSIVNADGLKSKPVMTFVRILSFEKAVQNPGLVAAMNQQLNYYMLVSQFGHQTLTARIIYQNINYQITGTIAQWQQFLSWQKPVNKFDVKSN